MNLRKIRQKKGEVFQIIFLIVIITISAIIGLIFLTMSYRINDAMNDYKILPENSTAAIVNNNVKQVNINATDELILFLFLGMNIGVILAAVRTKFSPVIIFLFILLTLMAILISSGLVNIYQGLAQSEAIQDVSATQMFTNIILSRYTPLFMCILSGIVIIIMYSKSGSEIQT